MSMTHEDFIEAFKRFSDWAIISNEPFADSSLKPGTISYLQSYVEALSDRMKDLNDVLVAEGNRLLSEAGNTEGLDTSKLKDEIFELGKDAFNRFVGKYKPGK